MSIALDRNRRPKSRIGSSGPDFGESRRMVRCDESALATDSSQGLVSLMRPREVWRRLKRPGTSQFLGEARCEKSCTPLGAPPRFGRTPRATSEARRACARA